jgi:hypothetical protein
VRVGALRADDPHVTFAHVRVSPTQITGQLQRPGAPAMDFATSRAGLPE